MILPGISGSFILVLLGSYSVVLGALKDFDLTVIAVVGLGAVIGLLSFARLLKTMFARYHDVTIALLSGFLLGSLNKIWPWKRVDEVMVKHAGEADEEVKAIVEQTVLPGDYTIFRLEGTEVVEQIPADPQLWPAIGLALGGAVLIFLMEFVARPKSK